MSANKPGTPITLPKIAKSVTLNVPSTPPPAKAKRLLALLATPEQPVELPFSPALKRTNSGTLKSPDYKFNESPYSSGVLKTPRNSGYDSDDKETPRRKLLRTPQFFSPGRRLFAEEHSPNKEELAEISLQLKSRLSLALGRIKGDKPVAPVKLDFSESFTQTLPPPKKIISLLPPLRTNVNLQTLQQLPAPNRSPKLSPDRLMRSPIADSGDRINIPLPDEELSAHNALLAAFSRLRAKPRSLSTNERRRLSAVQALENHPFSGPPAPLKLPPINVAFDKNKDSEQDAVYSLMSLSSPQLVKMVTRTHSRLQSQNNNSPTSLRSSSIAHTVLPPISGLIRKVDNDETDVDETTDEDMSS